MANVKTRPAPAFCVENKFFMADPITPQADPAAPPVNIPTKATPVEVQQQLPLDTPAPATLVEKLAALGFENLKDDAEATDRLIQAFQEQKSQNESLGDQVRQALYELRASQQPQQPQPAQASSWWNPPQVDSHLVAQYRTADGWKPETPSQIRQAYEAREAHKAKFANDLLENPKNTLLPLLKEVFSETFTQQYSQLTAQQQYQQQLASNEWLWEKDPQNGRPTQRLSREGERFNELLIQIEEDIPDKGKALKYALMFRDKEQAAAQATRLTPEQAAAANVEKKAGLLAAAAPALNRNGSLPQPGTKPPSNRNLSAGQRLYQEMQKNGTKIY
jgi:hypothetical protein